MTNAPSDLELARLILGHVTTWRATLDDVPSRSPEFAGLVLRILDPMIRELHHLELGIQGRPHLAAWACRNLLELGIITRYCLRADANWRNFANDMWIDGEQIFVKVKEQQTLVAEQLRRALVDLEMPTDRNSVDDTALDQTISNFRQRRESLNLGSRYTDITAMAKAVDMTDKWSAMNKLTSKLVHPTAFSILAFENVGDMGLLAQTFVHSGLQYAGQVVEDVKAHVNKQDLNPPA
jgi:hypothetical protein